MIYRIRGPGFCEEQVGHAPGRHSEYRFVQIPPSVSSARVPMRAGKSFFNDTPEVAFLKKYSEIPANSQMTVSACRGSQWDTQDRKLILTHFHNK